MSPSTDLTHFEARIYEEIAAYEEATGEPLRCGGFASRGKSGFGRLESHLIFQKAPNMVLLKRLMRKIGSVKVSGEYDDGEDWTQLSQEFKNHPPHGGCTHYTAQHAEHADARRIWNKVLPMGRKTVAPAKPDSPARAREEGRDAEFRRELENKVWLGQNKQPPINGALKTGERRVVRGHVMRELPRSVSRPTPMMLTAAEAAPRRLELAAGKRRLLPNGQVVMTLPRNDSARTSRTT